MYSISVTDYARDALLRSALLSASFNLRVRAFLRRFSDRVIDYIRSDLNG